MLDCNAALQFSHPDRYFPIPPAISPANDEVLSIPFHVAGQPVGTIWVTAHDGSRRFDAEDERLMSSLGKFAASAYQTLASLDALRLQEAEREKAQDALLRSETNLRDFVETAPIALHWVSADGIILWANQAELDLLGYTREEYIGHHIAEFHADQPVIQDMLARLTRGEALTEYAARLRHRDGSIRHVVVSSSALFEAGKFVHTRCFTRDITGQKQAEETLQERSRLDSFAADIGRRLVESSDLRDMLGRCTQTMVAGLDAAFARVWTLDEPGGVLELQASSGIYTRVDDSHARVPLGSFKVGLIGAERKSHLTNQVIGDPRVPEQEWARREGMVAFAGYPLVVEDRLVGVIGMFSRRAQSDLTLKALERVADQIAIAIDRKRAEMALASEEFNKQIIASSHDCIKVLDLRGNLLFMSESGRQLLEISDVTPYLNCSWVDFWRWPAGRASCHRFGKGGRHRPVSRLLPYRTR